jgi:hypothetical protein
MTSEKIASASEANDSLLWDDKESTRADHGPEKDIFHPIFTNQVLLLSTPE